MIYFSTSWLSIGRLEVTCISQKCRRKKVDFSAAASAKPTFSLPSCPQGAPLNVSTG
jgi:hypothetical protein